MPEKFEEIKTDKAPAAIGPYVQGLTPKNPGKPVFLSGQIPINPETGKIEAATIEEQTQQVFDNIEAVLNAAGLTLKDVTHVGVRLHDIADYKAVNAIYAERFGEHKPTREAFGGLDLPLGAKIEITVQAWKEDSAA